MKVPVVEPDADLRAFLLQALEMESYDARPAGSGRAAAAMVATWRPDLIVAGLDIPYLEGWDFLRRHLYSSGP